MPRSSFLALLIAGLLWSLGLPSPPVLATEGAGPIDVEAELRKIDGYIEATPNNDVLQHPPTLKPRDLYRNYIVKTQQISQQLLQLKKESETQNKRISLQRLSALTQSLAAENANLNRKIGQAEMALASYQLIQQAVETLEDTVAYWRVSNRYRSLYRGTLQEKTDDDEVLRTKLEAAFQAITELQELEHVRATLEKSLAD